MEQEPKTDNRQESKESKIDKAIETLKSLEWSLQSLGDEGYPEPQLIRLAGRAGVAKLAQDKVDEVIKSLEELKK